MKRRKGGLSEEGWTFVETLIVIAIILILTGTVGFVSFRYIDSAKEVAARTQVDAFSLALNAYLFDNGTYPTQEQGLDALWQSPTAAPDPPHWRGPYIARKVPLDPWGHPYEYRVPGVLGLPFGIRSFGADGTDGGDGNEKDIGSWDP
ncbi:MAG TPA: type II secretion system major pseudopilin GspG [Spirochaetia bacterium]|nr:type II secretion system major pseudopilin GspG [Spirochaetia bacterium]